MHPRQRRAFEEELALGEAALAARAMADAYARFERAHVLGQYGVWPHVRSHWAFLRWGLVARRGREVAGQLLRIVAGAIGSAIGKLPHGNTGGANVSPTRPMPLPPDLEAIIEDRQHGSAAG
jgi:hypothetical protein